ncbi:MAG: hypothetical protein COV72_03380 [Candidatus Omnitrophica bacterium CG11_big_fil_rev_8_21_14_0_20_42_13]|uniref:Uncharacterized protein n=1 Tax=Candidatus Ghiorseimicrobium undicola TaxID=1974746 RepID=A0A2H0LYD7_9BACT|nr:MAG: hypothetical protein COV72_03380 [Candidatus Omnitrophica bacterium CG11_big_fil_rev_8_21_14_0_20_42_13]
MKKDLVVLFYPKTEPDNIYRNLPISILKLASQVIASGYRVRVVDSRIEEDYEPVIRQIAGETLCFGVSAMTGFQINHGIKASEIAKRINHDIPVVWGGWHASLLPSQTLENDFIDIAVIGQGERTLSELLGVLANGGDFKNISGIAFKDQNGAVIQNTCRRFEDIDNFAPVNFEAINIDKYINESELGKRTISWNTSQGCPFCCGFCCTPVLYGRNWASLSVERILGEIETLISRFNVDSILFAEDNFFTNRERVSAICTEIVKRKLKFHWSTDGRIDQILRLEPELFSLLNESGCHKIYLGAESGDQDVLNLIDKKIKREDTYKAVDLLGRHNIKAELFLMVGFPLNPKKDLNETLKMISGIKRNYPNHQATPFLYTPYPGTKLFDLAKNYGLRPPGSLRAWGNWSLLAPISPWIDKSYLDRVNRLVKFYLPFAYPSDSLRKRMEKGVSGYFYRIMHRIAKFRIEKNILIFPIEWQVVKFIYYKVMLRYNIFKNLSVPR